MKSSKRRWRPTLRPRAGRRILPKLRPRAGRTIPPELRAENVATLASALPEGVRDPGFPLLLRRIDEAPFLEGNRVSAYFKGEEAFAAARQAIDEAKQEVLVESYILKDDRTGQIFLDVVGNAVGRGVTVKVLADAWGSFMTSRSFWREMRRRGVEVRLFNPLFPQLLFQPLRDHRKILVVDRRIGFTGGMNIGDEYGSGLGSSTGPWRDTHACVVGPSAWELAVVFSEDWQWSGGAKLDLPPLEPQAPGGAAVLVLDSRPGRGHGETASALAAIIAAARERLWITNAYFAPRVLAIRMLGEAARRGVDVRLLLPGKTDVPLVRHAGHGHYTPLLDAGVRIFEYEPSILHAKTLVADDWVSVVGSTNLDFRSFHFNAECNLVILDQATGRAFADAFREDLLHSRQIGTEQWKRRTVLHRFGDAAARSLRPLL